MGARAKGTVAILATLGAFASCRALLAIDEKELGFDDAGLDGGGAEASSESGADGAGEGGGTCAAAAETLCSNGCTDVLQDGENCGTCGRVCPGACDTGRCVGKVVAQTGGSAVQLTETADALFWTTPAAPRVRRLAKKGGTSAETITATSGPASGLALREPWVYWATSGSPSILRHPIDGGATSQIVTGLTDAAFLVADDTTVWFTRSANPGDVRQAPVTGGTSTVIVDAVATPVRIVVDADHVYYTADDPPDLGVWKVDKTGAGKVRLYTGKVYSLASDALFLFTVDPLSGSILRIAKADGAKTVLVSGENIAEIDADEGDVYWTSPDGTVSRVSKSGGGAAQRLAVAHVDAHEIVAAYPGAVYWFAGQQIFTTPK